MCQIRKEVRPEGLRTARSGNQKREMNMALKRLKEAGTKLICLSPNINFLTDLVHFCYPSPVLEKKLHHFCSSAFIPPSSWVPPASSSMLDVSMAQRHWTWPARVSGSEWLLLDFCGTEDSFHTVSSIGPWESREGDGPRI